MPPTGPAACMIRLARPRHRTARRFLPPHSLPGPPRASGHEEPKPRGNAYIERHGPDRQDPASVRASRQERRHRARRRGSGLPGELSRPIAPDRIPMLRFSVILSSARRPADGTSASRRRIGHPCRPRFSSCRATTFSMTRDHGRTRLSRIKGCSRLRSRRAESREHRRGEPTGTFPWGDDDASHRFDPCPDRRRESDHRGSREAERFAVRDRGSDSPTSRLRACGGVRRVPRRSGNEIRSRAISVWRGRRPRAKIRPTRGGRRPAGPPMSFRRRPICADFRRSLRKWTRPPEGRCGFSAFRKRQRAAWR